MKKVSASCHTGNQVDWLWWLTRANPVILMSAKRVKQELLIGQTILLTSSSKIRISTKNNKKKQERKNHHLIIRVLLPNKRLRILIRSPMLKVIWVPKVIHDRLVAYREPPVKVKIYWQKINSYLVLRLRKWTNHRTRAWLNLRAHQQNQRRDLQLVLIRHQFYKGRNLVNARKRRKNKPSWKMRRP